MNDPVLVHPAHDSTATPPQSIASIPSAALGTAASRDDGVVGTVGAGDGAPSGTAPTIDRAANSITAPTGFSRTAAGLLALGAYAVPYALSRSTTPSPDHPRVLLWYKTLSQPAFKPPDIAIPLAWGGIQTGLAVAAYRLLRLPDSPDRNRSLGWLAGNVVAIGGWSSLFFGGRNLPASTVAAAAMIGTSAAYVAQARRSDGVAAATGVPLTLWVGFATVLTAAIWRRNR